MNKIKYIKKQDQEAISRLNWLIRYVDKRQGDCKARENLLDLREFIAEGFWS